MCSICHNSPSQRNLFGQDFLKLKNEFASDLNKVWLNLEGRDSDGDGIKNIDELMAGTNPGNL
jgi:hypothetical protein